MYNVAIWVHPLWTNYLKGNFVELDKILKYLEGFDKVIIYFPQARVEYKKRVISKVLPLLEFADETKPEESFMGVRLNLIKKKLLSHGFKKTRLKKFRLYGTTSKFNHYTSHSIKKKLTSKLIDLILKRHLPVLRIEPLFDPLYWHTKKYILSKDTGNFIVVDTGAHSADYSKKLKNTAKYTLLGEYSNQCVKEVQDILLSNNLEVSVAYEYCVCNGRVDYPQKEYLYIEHDVPKVKI